MSTIGGFKSSVRQGEYFARVGLVFAGGFVDNNKQYGAI
jgi:hypothetical protein